MKKIYSFFLLLFTICVSSQCTVNSTLSSIKTFALVPNEIYVVANINGKGTLLKVKSENGGASNMFGMKVQNGNYSNIYPFNYLLGSQKFNSNITTLNFINGQTLIGFENGKLLKIYGSGGVGDNMFNLSESFDGFDINPNYQSYLVGYQKFSSAVTNIIEANNHLLIGFKNGKLLKIASIGGTGTNMFGIKETANGFENTSNIIHRVGDMVFNSAITTLNYIENENVTLIGFANGKLLKVKGTGSSGSNMFNVSENSSGFESNPQWEIHRIGDQVFNAAVTHVLNVNNETLVAIANGRLLKVSGTGGSGSNMFAINVTSEGFPSVSGYNYRRGDQIFDSPIATIQNVTIYGQNQTFVALENGQLLKVRGVGASGYNMFNIEKDASGFHSITDVDYWIYRIGDAKFNSKVTGILLDGTQTYFGFANGKLLKVKETGGSGYNMFNLSEDADGFVSNPQWETRRIGDQNFRDLQCFNNNTAATSGYLIGTKEDKENLDKYWKLRNVFRERFVKIGKGAGESLPIGSINPNSCTPGAAENWQHIYADLHWGDGMIRQGQYLQLLATEYKLLKDSGQDTRGTLNELYYALQAINRCDLKAEPTQGSLYGMNLSENLNGFYLREDVPEDFGTNNWGNTPLKPRCVDSANYQNKDVAKTTARGFEENNDPSLDQLSSLLVGFSLIHKLVDNEYVQPTPQDPVIQIVTEMQAILTRMVSHMSYNNWYMLNVKGWPVTNGGGDLPLTAFPILQTAQRITGNFTFPTEIKRRTYFSFGEHIQPCITGFGLDGKKDPERTSCGDIPNFFGSPERIAYNRLKDVPFLNWSKEGSVDLNVFTASFVWHTFLPNLESTVEYADANFQALRNALVESNPIIDLYKTMKTNKIEMKEYNKTLLFNLAVSSGIWNKNVVKAWTDYTSNYSLEAINAVLKHDTPVTSKEKFQSLLNTMKPEGPYRLYGASGHTNADGKWIEDEEVIKMLPDWFSEYRWNKSGGNSFGAYKGLFNGIDYMLMHNLYYLLYGSSMPKFEEEVNCNCESSTITYSETPSISGSIHDINLRLKFLEPCTPNAFASINNDITGTFNLDNHFPHYKDIAIYDTKVQTESAFVSYGATLNVNTNFVICNNKRLKVATNGFVNCIKGSITLKSGAEIDIYGSLRMGWGTKLVMKPGSKIILRPGARLFLESHGKLIVNEGSKIEIYNDARIEQHGENSEIQLKGEIKLMDDVQSTIIKQTGTISGKLIVEGTAKFTASSPTKLVMEGLGKDKPFIMLQKDCTLNIDNTNITEFRLYNSRMEMDENSFINIKSKTNFFKCALVSSKSNNGVALYNGSRLQSCNIENVPLFVKLLNNEGTTEINYTEFVNQDINYSGAFENLFTQEGMGYSFSFCKFKSGSKNAIATVNLTKNSTVSNSEFSGSGNGINDNSSIDVTINKSTFTSLATGVSKKQGALNLKCSTFDCTKAINAEYCFVNLSIEDGAGYNSFKCSGNESIYLIKSGIKLYKGYNKFQDSNPFYIVGDAPYKFLHIDFSYNQWNTSNTVPQEDKFLYVYNTFQSSYYITVTADYPTIQPVCGAFDPALDNNNVGGVLGAFTGKSASNNLEDANESSTNSLDTSSNEIKIYPNPTKDIINIDLSNIIANKILIYNNLGKIVFEKNVKSIDKLVSFDLSGLNQNIYLIYIQTNNGQIVRKIIKN